MLVLVKSTQNTFYVKYDLIVCGGRLVWPMAIACGAMTSPSRGFESRPPRFCYTEFSLCRLAFWIIVFHLFLPSTSMSEA